MAFRVPPATAMGPATPPGWLVTVVPGLIVSVTPAGTVTPDDGSVTVPDPQQLVAAEIAPITGPVSPPVHAIAAAGDAKQAPPVLPLPDAAPVLPPPDAAPALPLPAGLALPDAAPAPLIDPLGPPAPDGLPQAEPIRRARAMGQSSVRVVRHSVGRVVFALNDVSVQNAAWRRRARIRALP
jgi:hypothetical protein